MADEGVVMTFPRMVQEFQRAPIATDLNETIRLAAIRAGCSKAEARLLGQYVVSEGIKEAASRLGIAEQTARNQSVALKRRLGVGHLAAAVAQVLTQ